MLCEMTAEYGPLEIMSVTQWRNLTCEQSHGKACGRAWYFRHERLSKEIAFWTDGKACGRAWYFRRFGTATADDVRDVVWQSLREGFVLSTEHMDHLAGGRNQFTFSWE